MNRLSFLNYVPGHEGYEYGLTEHRKEVGFDFLVYVLPNYADANIGNVKGYLRYLAGAQPTRASSGALLKVKGTYLRP